MKQPGSSPPSASGSAASSPARLLARAVEYHRQGQLQQAAALYRRIPPAYSGYPDAQHLLGLIEHATGRHGPALQLIERAIAANGGIAAFHVSRAAVLSALGRFEPAMIAARRALTLDAGNAEAHNALGNVLLKLDDPVQAAESYRRALAIRPEYAEAHNNFGSAMRAQGYVAEAEAALLQAIRLRPGYASALANLGLLLQDQGRYDEALDALDRAVAADPQHPAAHGNRALLLLLLGRLAEGFAEYEWRWQMPGFSTPRREFVQPCWDGGDLNGRTLLLHAEQGLGSAIQFVRYAPLAAAGGGRIVLECQPPLLRLFQQSLAGADGPVATVVRKGESLPQFDVHAPLMSLPHLLGTTLATVPAQIPYLRADPEDVETWSRRLANLPAPRIGLVWAGNPQHENDHNRSMPAGALAPLLANAAVRFVSLQLPADPGAACAFAGRAIVDLAPNLRDFADTAAVIANLDLVISVDTAAAHLAGALGRPAWLMLPCVPEWRWLLHRHDTPWYPSLRLFRQRAPGDWGELVERVDAALSNQFQRSGAPEWHDS